MRLLRLCNVATSCAPCWGSTEWLKAIVDWCGGSRSGSGSTAHRCRCFLLLLSLAAKEGGHLGGATTGKLSNLATGTEDFARAGVDHVALVVGWLWNRVKALLRLGDVRRSSDGRGGRRASVVRDGQLANGRVLGQLGKFGEVGSDVNIVLLEEENKVFLVKTM